MAAASKTTPVTITIPANSARLAGEELYQSARQARDNGEDALADILEQAASALHEAGWSVVLGRGHQSPRPATSTSPAAEAC